MMRKECNGIQSGPSWQSSEIIELFGFGGVLVFNVCDSILYALRMFDGVDFGVLDFVSSLLTTFVFQKALEYEPNY